MNEKHQRKEQKEKPDRELNHDELDLATGGIEAFGHRDSFNPQPDPPG